MTDIVISLTSIKKRYDDKLLHKTLNSLINLDTKCIIVLNISKEPKLLDTGFTDNDIKCLKNLYPQIIINITENYGSLRKLIPTLKLFKNHIIITVDDDTIYSKNMIEKFINSYNDNKCVISSRCRYIDNININITELKFVINNIKNTKSKFCNKCNMNIIPEGVGGILYHSSWFDSKFINFDFNTLHIEFLTNDDLVLRAYTYIKNIAVYKIDCNYKDRCPSVGLWINYNASYTINFNNYIEKVKSISNWE